MRQEVQGGTQGVQGAAAGTQGVQGAAAVTAVAPAAVTTAVTASSPPAAVTASAPPAAVALAAVASSSQDVCNTTIQTILDTSNQQCNPLDDCSGNITSLLATSNNECNKPPGIEDYEKKISKVLESLDIKNTGATQASYQRIIDKLKGFNDNDKFKLVDFIDNNNEGSPFKELQNADKIIKELMENSNDTPTKSNNYKGILFKYKDSIKSEWDATIEQLGELQALVLIERITNCDDAIKALLEAFTAKMTAVNVILKSRLGASASATASASTTASASASATASASALTPVSTSIPASRTRTRTISDKYYKTNSNAIYDKYIKYKMKYINYKKFINNNN